MTMKDHDKNLSEAQSLLRRGLDPEMVENLQRSQEAWKKQGEHLSLEEIFYMDVEDTSILDAEFPELTAEEESLKAEESGKKNLAQVYRGAGSALTIQGLATNSTPQ